MADFVQTMKDWRRMCNTIKSCNDCPMYKEDGWTYVLCSEGGISSARPEVAEKVIAKWAAEHAEPVYPTIAKYLEQFGITIRRDGSLQADFFKANEPMSADMAKMLGISSGECENEKTD